MDIHTTFGYALVGLVASSIIYGLTVLQTFTYFRRYPNDQKRLKFMVLGLWMLDTLHLCFCTVSMYWYLVTNYNNPAQLAFTHWSMNLQVDCNGIIGMVVELFFAVRVYRLSKNWILTGLISVLALLHFALGVYFSKEAFSLKTFSRYPELTWVTSTGLGSAAACDIIIAVSLVYLLHRSRTGFERTDSLITSLMVYAINTGAVTSLCATLTVILYATMPVNFLWLAFFWCLGKLYVNSLLASLNSREYLREKAKAANGTFVHLSHFRSENGQDTQQGRHVRGTSGGPRQLAVTVETTKEQRSDFYDTQSSADDQEKPFTTLSASNKV